MKTVVMICFPALLLLTGCSESEELGRDMADGIRQPIEEARSVYEKARKTREPELPE